MDELHRAADKLRREQQILDEMTEEWFAPGRPATITTSVMDLIVSQGKRVRNASTVLVRVAARRRDEQLQA